MQHISMYKDMERCIVGCAACTHARHSIVSDTLIWQLQSYAAQQRGQDVHMSDARLVQADRRMDRRGRGSRDRADVRRQRFDDPADNGRYAQVHTSDVLPMQHGVKFVT